MLRLKACQEKTIKEALKTRSFGEANNCLTLLSRSYCHLCDEMASGIAPLLAAFGASLEVIDVDQHPHLEARYGERIPVLLHGETELCCFVLDADKVRHYLLYSQTS